MKEAILNTLQSIEKDYDVKILYACESGSRAWGFPSKDSDYDVRFIYVHRRDDYLTIDPIGIGKKSDVIELPINDLLDVSGWELTKALKLFRKSNPPLMEWLRSGIIYYEAFSTIEKMKGLSEEAFSPIASIHHYLHMASNNFREYLQRDAVKIKKYFYVLRPVMAARWIEKYKEFPPLEFSMLLEHVIPEGELKKEIQTLLNRKLAGEEFDLEPRIEVLHKFLHGEIICLGKVAKEQVNSHQDITPKLNQLFQDTLSEVWK